MKALIPLFPTLTAAALTISCGKKPESPPEPVREIPGASTPSQQAENQLPPVEVPPEMEKPVPPETARADFAKLLGEQKQFNTARIRRAQSYYSKVMARLAATLREEKEGISQETFLSYNDKVGNIISKLDAEGRALKQEMQRHQQSWIAKNWDGYVLLEHFPAPADAAPDMSKWPRTAPETTAVTAAREDFLERRATAYRDAMAAAEAKLIFAWKRCEQMRATLPVPAPKDKLSEILTTVKRFRSDVDTALHAVQQARTESETRWLEWEAKKWDGYVIEKKPPGADKLSLLPPPPK